MSRPLSTSYRPRVNEEFGLRDERPLTAPDQTNFHLSLSDRVTNAYFIGFSARISVPGRVN